MKQTIPEFADLATQVIAIGEARHWMIAECHTRIEATRLYVEANKLGIEAHRLSAKARDKQRRARLLLKDKRIPQCEIDDLRQDAQSLLTCAGQLQSEVLALVAQSMRLRARLVL